MRETLSFLSNKVRAVRETFFDEETKENLDKKIKVVKAEFMMKVAGLIFENHDNPVGKTASKAAGWVNKKRYGGRKSLGFLEHEESIDIMDDSQYETDKKMTK